MRYAQRTAVPIEESHAEIEKMLIKFGATAFASSWDSTTARIGFGYNGLEIRFELKLPNPNDRKYTHKGEREISLTTREATYKQECKRLWRALVLVVKAKLESVRSGVASFEGEFLSYVVVPGSNGSTIGSIAIPRLKDHCDPMTGRTLALPQVAGTR